MFLVCHSEVTTVPEESDIEVPGAKTKGVSSLSGHGPGGTTGEGLKPKVPEFTKGSE